MAGEEGFEPSNAGSKDPCLSHLATPQRLTVNCDTFERFGQFKAAFKQRR